MVKCQQTKGELAMGIRILSACATIRSLETNAGSALVMPAAGREP